MSEYAVEVPDTNKLKELVHLQASLWEAAQRLPKGTEREDALREISGFQNRLATFIQAAWFGDLAGFEERLRKRWTLSGH